MLIYILLFIFQCQVAFAASSTAGLALTLSQLAKAEESSVPDVFPWLALIETPSRRCSGVLIESPAIPPEEFILTSSDCVIMEQYLRTSKRVQRWQNCAYRIKRKICYAAYYARRGDSFYPLRDRIEHPENCKVEGDTISCGPFKSEQILSNGSPLMCQGSDARWTLYGILSDNKTTEKAIGKSVYLPASKYTEFISSASIGALQPAPSF
ncbi:putative serine protease [Trichinella spiralis]|uniref:Serine protease n=1 Tax=Trichinella spiralis TaxID=6334 RepID=A0ABR3K8D9_TRISP